MNLQEAVDNIFLFGRFKKISDLIPTAQLLNQESDYLTQLINKIESRLNALCLGIEVGVVLKHEDREIRYDFPDQSSSTQPTTTVISLVYGRIKSKDWGLIGQSQIYQRGILLLETRLPLNDCSRELRILALDSIYELLDELEQSAKTIIEKISKIRRPNAATNRTHYT